MSPHSKTLKLGTRRSLLAWAQSGWVASEIERLNPGTRVELVGIDTRGDQIQDVPLQSIPGKDFFVAELDEQLRSGRVDLTVHSLKDLSLERPREFVSAAIPRRENPRDVAIFGPRAIDRLRQGEKIRIGTSSPRRLENVPGFLREALPRFSEKAPELEFVEIRGNVNTRLGRVLEEVGSERFLDGVILAFAGIARLWADEKARIEAKELLERVRWMVLPLAENPTAPGQGALAIECRLADGETLQKIAKLHDPETAAHVHRERETLAKWGGGCHQRFGATSFSARELGSLLRIKGRAPDGAAIDELKWNVPGLRPSGFVAWNGAEWAGRRALSRPVELPDLSARAVFAAHSRALPGTFALNVESSRVWCSGTKSWFKLARQGVWVEGCAENLGFEWLARTLAEPVLSLPPLEEWTVLTHEAGAPGWKGKVGNAIGTYRMEERPTEMTPELQEEIRSSTHFWWSSGTQFDALQEYLPRDAHHACGPGKTLEHLRSHRLSPSVFPSAENWKEWLGI